MQIITFFLKQIKRISGEGGLDTNWGPKSNSSRFFIPGSTRAKELNLNSRKKYSKMNKSDLTTSFSNCRC